MIDSFVKILEKAGQLAESRKFSRQRYLRDVLEPLFEEFRSLHKSYLTRFENLLDSPSLAKNGVDSFSKEVSRDILFKSHEPRALLVKLNALGKWPDLVRTLTYYLVWSIPDEKRVELAEEKAKNDMPVIMVNTGSMPNAVSRFSDISDDLIKEARLAIQRMERTLNKKPVVPNNVNLQLAGEIHATIAELQRRYILVEGQFYAVMTELKQR